MLLAANSVHALDLGKRRLLLRLRMHRCLEILVHSEKNGRDWCRTNRLREAFIDTRHEPLHLSTPIVIGTDHPSTRDANLTAVCDTRRVAAVMRDVQRDRVVLHIVEADTAQV